MAIDIYTMCPKSLLDAIRRAIDDDDIQTWEHDDNGNFTYSLQPWKEQAWLCPHVYSDQGLLRLGLYARTGTGISKALYGVYHGRFVEMLLMHFYGKFTKAIITGQLIQGLDDVPDVPHGP